MSRQQMNEELFELMLKYAAKEYVEKSAAELSEWCSTQPDPQFSQEFEQKMSRLCKRQHLKDFGRKTIKPLKRVAVVILVLCVSFASLMSVEAFRVGILNFVYTAKEDHTVFEFHAPDGTGNTMADLQSMGCYLPTYLPEGYHLEDFDVMHSLAFHSYTNAEGARITLTQGLGQNMTMAIDTEDALTRDVRVGMNPGFISLKGNQIILVWTVGDMAFNISSDQIGENELMKVAESLEYKKVEG